MFGDNCIGLPLLRLPALWHYEFNDSPMIYDL